MHDYLFGWFSARWSSIESVPTRGWDLANLTSDTNIAPRTSDQTNWAINGTSRPYETEGPDPNEAQDRARSVPAGFEHRRGPDPSAEPLNGGTVSSCVITAGPLRR